MNIAEATRQYQDALEAKRSDPENEDLWDQLLFAKDQMEIIYLQSMEDRFDWDGDED